MKPLTCLGPRPHRRDILQAGTLGLLGLGLEGLSAKSAMAESRRPPAKAVIFLFMWGGPSQLDTWDLKPNAPLEVRGPFQPIQTTVPGLQISEHFPHLSRRAHQYTVIRSLHHTDVAHLSSVHHLLTGRLAPKINSDADPPSRHDTPHIGSMLDKLSPTRVGVPGFVTVPWMVSHPAAPGGQAPGQNGGWLGPAYDPFLVTGDPNAPNFRIAGLDRPSSGLGRFDLLRQLDQSATAPGFGAAQQKAIHLMTSDAVQRAFDLGAEPPKTRDRYGRNIHGQACLLARRLVESGVRLVCVNWHNDGRSFWDTHGDNFNQLKTRLMPPTDLAFSALLDDLDNRGMLEETLIVWAGEFGRAPRITPNNAGREHHAKCYSAVLAGGGVRGGQVYGASDKIAAYPLDKPVSPADLTATIYHALGIHPETLVDDRQGRPLPITQGQALTTVFG